MGEHCHPGHPDASCQVVQWPELCCSWRPSAGGRVSTSGTGSAIGLLSLPWSCCHFPGAAVTSLGFPQASSGLRELNHINVAFKSSSICPADISQDARRILARVLRRFRRVVQSWQEKELGQPPFQACLEAPLPQV